MIDVYVRNIQEDKAKFLGAFKPNEIMGLPELFDTFITIGDEGKRCQIYDTHFVLEQKVSFQITVEPIEE